MDANEKTIALFSTRVRQLILQYGDLQRENAALRDRIKERDERISQLEAGLICETQKYNSLKMAKILEITDGDLEQANKRVAKLIRDVEKCITLVKEK